MIATQTAVIAVPAAVSDILTIRETNSYSRSFCLRNLSDNTLAFQFQEYTASGWKDLGDPFNLGAAGTTTDSVVKLISSTNPLRIRASGGDNDRDLEVSYTRLYDSDTFTWVLPYLS